MKELKNKKIAIWGCGKEFQIKKEFIGEYIKPIICVDINKSLHGKEMLRECICISPEQLSDYEIDLIVITLKNRLLVQEIKDMISNKHQCVHFNEIFDKVEMERFKNHRFDNSSKKMMHFSCSIGSCACNMGCSYCYIDFDDPKIKHNSYFTHSVEFMTSALSKKRLGGLAFFNIAGEGETLLKPEIIELTRGLLNHGHCVSLITNGTITSKMIEMTAFSEDLKSRLLVQCSLHFKELKRKNLIEIYFNNINLLRDNGISVNATMVGSDEDIVHIPEIKRLFLEQLGFLPMISSIRTVTKDKKEGFPFGSKFTWEEYVDVWREFASQSIECRKHTLGKIDEMCYAGMSTGNLNLDTGDLYSCIPGKKLGNIYEDITSNVPFLKEPHKCDYGYCSHNGLYLSGRVINGVVLPTFYEFHTRFDKEGNSTFSEEIKKATDFCCDY